MTQRLRSSGRRSGGRWRRGIKLFSAVEALDTQPTSLIEVLAAEITDEHNKPRDTVSPPHACNESKGGGPPKGPRPRRGRKARSSYGQP
jgi:hypothetical protein